MDSASIKNGKRLVQVRGCTDCHGGNLAGKLFIENPMFGTIYTPNLTSGKGGIGSHYSDGDWERAIRHGIGKDGKPLLIMPAHEYFFLSNEDLNAIIVYLKTIPSVDKEIPENSIGPIARILYLKGDLSLIPAEQIDHSQEHPEAPKPGISVAYGEYLAIGCIGCHGKDFKGGPIPGMPPDWPPAADITPGGKLKNWSEEDFITAMRTGIKPDGQPFSPYMPYQTLQAMTDTELRALWLFLSSLPTNSDAQITTSQKQ